MKNKKINIVKTIIATCFILVAINFIAPNNVYAKLEFPPIDIGRYI